MRFTRMLTYLLTLLIFIALATGCGSTPSPGGGTNDEDGRDDLGQWQYDSGVDPITGDVITIIVVEAQAYPQLAEGASFALACVGNTRQGMLSSMRYLGASSDAYDVTYSFDSSSPTSESWAASNGDDLLTDLYLSEQQFDALVDQAFGKEQLAVRAFNFIGDSYTYVFDWRGFDNAYGLLPCVEGMDHDSSITIDQDDQRIEWTESVALTARLTSSDASEAIRWHVEDPTIATIDAETGVLQGRRFGGTTVVAVSASDLTVRDSIQVSVYADAAHVAAGSWFDQNHALVLLEDGTVRGWGSRTFWQLGNCTSRDCEPISTHPITVPDVYKTVQVAAGGMHSLALMDNGTVMGWGGSNYGQGPNKPTRLAALENVIEIAAGARFSLALLDDRTVQGWGWNEDGQVDPGSDLRVVFYTSPAHIGGISNAVGVAAGYGFGLALTADGRVRAWGSPDQNQLDDADSDGYVDGIVDATSVAAGKWHSLALTSDGTIRSWGSNTYGQLGDIDEDGIVDGVEDATAIAAGAGHSVALLENGSVLTWGDNSAGQLGNGGSIASPTPVTVTDLTGVSTIAAAGDFSLAVLGSGEVMGWGDNATGQLGHAGASIRRTPFPVQDIP